MHVSSCRSHVREQANTEKAALLCVASSQLAYGHFAYLEDETSFAQMFPQLF
jgi:hypothetical protein